MHLLHLCIWLQLYFMRSFLHFLYIAIASAKSFLLAIWYFEVLLLKIWKALQNITVLSRLSVVISEPLSSLVAERLLISHIKKVIVILQNFDELFCALLIQMIMFVIQ